MANIYKSNDRPISYNVRVEVNTTAHIMGIDQAFQFRCTGEDIIRWRAFYVEHYSKATVEFPEIKSNGEPQVLNAEFRIRVQDIALEKFHFAIREACVDINNCETKASILLNNVLDLTKRLTEAELRAQMEKDKLAKERQAVETERRTAKVQYDLALLDLAAAKKATCAVAGTLAEAKDELRELEEQKCYDQVYSSMPTQ